MSRFVRASKYRHVFGQAFKKEMRYDGIRLSKSTTTESTMCSVNTKFVAVIMEARGGGSFIVFPIDKYGRIDMNFPRVAGHTGPVLDLNWSPFNENIIASGSDDATVKIWQIPDEEMTETMSDAVVVLKGHQRKVTIVEWHPTANNILFSASADLTIRAWNVSKGEQFRQFEGFTDTIYAFSFNYDGSKFCSTSKDKKIRVFDAHSGKILQEGAGHTGSKGSRICWLGNKDLALSTGFSKMSERQYHLWNTNDLSKPVKQENIDTSSGIMMPFFDEDSNMVYIAGKGDANIRYYEVTGDEKSPIVYLDQYSSSDPQCGAGWLPKRACKVNECEVARFYKLHPKGVVEPISMIVPRKGDLFQEDLFPDCRNDVPALTADEFLAGKSAGPNLCSLKDGFVPSGKPAFVAVQVKEEKKDVIENPKTAADYEEAYHKLRQMVKDLSNQKAQLEVKVRALEAAK